MRELFFNPKKKNKRYIFVIAVEKTSFHSASENAIIRTCLKFHLNLSRRWNASSNPIQPKPLCASSLACWISQSRRESNNWNEVSKTCPAKTWVLLMRYQHLRREKLPCVDRVPKPLWAPANWNPIPRKLCRCLLSSKWSKLSQVLIPGCVISSNHTSHIHFSNCHQQAKSSSKITLQFSNH